MTIATVTSQNPIYPYCFTTLYKGQRFDVNIESGGVFFKGVNNNGSYSYKVQSENVRSIVMEAVEKHLTK